MNGSAVQWLCPSPGRKQELLLQQKPPVCMRPSASARPICASGVKRALVTEMTVVTCNPGALPRREWAEGSALAGGGTAFLSSGCASACPVLGPLCGKVPHGGSFPPWLLAVLCSRHWSVAVTASTALPSEARWPAA